jgi:hypothetical protein
MVDYIDYNTRSGWPGDVLEDILDSIEYNHNPGFVRDMLNWFQRNYTISWKVGQTVDPEHRADQYGDEYQYMDVVYETSSSRHADIMEQGITDEYIENDSNDNQRRGGAGRRPDDDDRTHYVYIVYNVH